MHLDVPTLMAMESFVTACAGLVLFIAWWHNNKNSVLGLWALSDVSAAGCILSFVLAIVLQKPVLSIMGSTLLALAPGLIWKAARDFDGKPAPALVALLGVGIVGLGGSIPAVGNIAGSLSLASGAIYLVAAATTLWLGRTDGLGARLPIIVLLAVHATVLSFGAYSMFVGAVSQNALPLVGTLFGLIHFESNIFTLGTAVFVLALVKERNEAAIGKAARIDGLTGIANRAAFVEGAERVIERCRREGAPVSVMMFDLDHFKVVNDTHGHAVGDEVLRKFGNVLAKALRPNDVFGRIGGEEFAVTLPASGIEAACVRAERIRADFADSCRFIADRQVNSTVSCGVSVSMDAEQPLSALLEHADIALYRAKAAGRNRVERANQPEPKGGSPNVFRVA